jgi:proteasome lid subunit RPN8/RPN11
MCSLPNEITIYKSVINKIAYSIPLDSLEYGGGLLGIEGKPIITEFLFDKKAKTSISSYTPSQDLFEEIEDPRVKGFIHSHPQGQWKLSDGDEKAMEEFLKINPGISYSIAIIVTKHDYNCKQDNNEYIFEFDQYKKICFFICYLNEGKLVNNPIKPIIIKENDQE